MGAIRPRRLLQRLHEGGLAPGARLVEQVEIGAIAMKLMPHRNEGRDADAAGQQQMAPGLRDDREVVARAGDDHRLAGGQHLMDLFRSAATILLA